MGLDGVELIMAIEDEFGVHIEDAEAEGCVTPRIVIDLVVAKVRETDREICPSQRAFYIARAALVQSCGVDRNAVKRATPLAELIPFEDQSTSWARLRVAMEVRSWPNLVRPKWVSWSSTVVVIAIMCGVGVWAIKREVWNASWLILPTGYIALSIVNYITHPWKNRIPTYHATVEKFSELAYSSAKMEWTRRGVAAVCKRIVMEQLWVEEKDYSEDASFVKDYGV